MKLRMKPNYTYIVSNIEQVESPASMLFMALAILPEEVHAFVVMALSIHCIGINSFI